MLNRVLLLLVCIAVLPIDALASPKIDYWRLKNGARVYFVESHELPMVQLSIAFDAGSARDPANRLGLALLANHLLKEGTASKNTNQVAETFEGLGAEFGTDVDRDMATVSLRSLSDRGKLLPAARLLADMIRNPAFPIKGLNRERQRLLVGLQQKKQSPDELASDEFFRLTYGQHPYAHATDGTEQDVKAITRDDLLEFHRRYYVGSNAVVAIIGDLKKREAKSLVKMLVGDLERGSPLPPLPEVREPATGQLVKITFPSKQSHIMVGQVGMHRKDPDYFKLYLGNYILGGGGLVSRLSEQVREKHGLSYSVYSYFWPMFRRGPFIMGLQTENKHQQKALSMMNDVLKDFINSGPTAEELKEAKTHITGGFALRVDTNKKIVNYLVVIGFYQLPLTYLDEFPKRIEQISAEDIRDAFSRRLLPEKMTTVIVGG
jgi:zinc protease